MSESFAELFEESQSLNEMSPGTIIKGIVVEISATEVIVNAGLKSEGFIPLYQFANDDGVSDVKVGDEIEVAIEALEDGFGMTRLSREKALRARMWDVLEEAMEKQEKVTGLITGRVKGGFTVEIGTVRAFLPGSLVDVRPVRDLSYLEGKELEFKVVKIDRRRNNVVISRRAVVETESNAERDALLESLQEGQVVKGIVKNLTDYGAFIDLGGIDGLLHITDMAWKRVKQPQDIVNVGDEVDVKVLKFDKERNRVSLGLKQLGEDPWEHIARRYPIGSQLFGKVTNIADYGCFVEIEDGVEGLVHVSEMDWTNKNIHPTKIVSLSQEVEVKILDVDVERRRISLGIKQCMENPWEDFSSRYSKGDRINGVIKSITDFGIFVGIDGGIDGLLHLSDLSWAESGEDLVRNFKKGDEIETIILSVDPERERISLGVKQLDTDPFSSYTGANPKGTIVKGKVSEVDAGQAIIDLGDDIQGTLRASDFSDQRVDDLRSELKIDDAVEALIISVDRKNRLIALSIKAKHQHDEAQAVKDYGTTASTSGGGMSSLGDLIKEKMGSDS